MKKHPLSIKSFGQRTLLVEWPNIVSEEILNEMLAFEQLLLEKLPGNFQYVMAYRSLAIICDEGIDNHDLLKKTILQWYQEMEEILATDRFLWKFPVCYDLDFGIDLQHVSESLQVPIENLVTMHTAQEYTVFGIGFLPGFMYLGGLPTQLETKRRQEPRLKVPKGAVGLAGQQTGMYPQESPGGWNIIGNCPISIFDAKKENPCFIKVGDKIQFEAISKAEYELYKIEGEVGISRLQKSRWHD